MEKRMRILQVNKLYYPETGGIERVVQYIAEGLNDRTDMKVLVCQKKGRGVSERINGVRVIRSSSLGVVSSVPVAPGFPRDLKRLSKNCDIIHCHMPFPLGDLAELLSGFKGKVVVWWHSDVVKQEKAMWLYRPLMERFLKRADLIMVASEGIIKGSKYLGPYRDKCVIIPLAVGQDVLEAGTAYLEHRSQESEDKQRPVRFLFVGRLVGYKGCSVLLEAFAKTDHAELTLVGTGPLESALKEQCEALGLQEKVHFAGHVSDQDMMKYFEETDVFVLPSVSRNEAFAIVQLEAMAFGKPVINTNLPSGVPYVSLHNQTGLTVEPGQAKELAEAMNWMIAHPEQRRLFGKAARERLEENFTLAKVIPQIYEAYKRLLNEPKLRN